MEKLRRRYETAAAEHKRDLIDQAMQLLGYLHKAAIGALDWRIPPLEPVVLTGRLVNFEPGLFRTLVAADLAGHRLCLRPALGRDVAGVNSCLRETQEIVEPTDLVFLNDANRNQLTTSRNRS